MQHMVRQRGTGLDIRLVALVAAMSSRVSSCICRRSRRLTDFKGLVSKCGGMIYRSTLVEEPLDRLGLFLWGVFFVRVACPKAGRQAGRQGGGRWLELNEKLTDQV